MMLELYYRRRTAAVVGAVVTVLAAIATVIEDELSTDGRSYRRPPSRRFSMRQSLFAVADLERGFNEGWFRNQFRCNKSSFETVYSMVEANWHRIHEPIGHNAAFFIRDRVAVTLFYLAHPGSLAEAGQVFGMSKASACRFVREIIDVIVDCLSKNIVKLPTRIQEWNELAIGFESICGFPNCCLAIDGSLFEIERMFNYEGWYCRKGFPAINAQLVVDHTGRVRSYDLRPGSANDKSIFNYSFFGRNIHRLLPAGRYIVADAGYTLSSQIITPYAENELDPIRDLFNYLHSRTRITVERAIGMIKNRFRILKMPLNQKHDTVGNRTQAQQMGRVMEACFTLHNLLIDLNDHTNCDDRELHEAEVDQPLGDRPIGDGISIRDGIAEYLFTNSQRLRDIHG